jgi:hypothetical protein
VKQNIHPVERVIRIALGAFLVSPLPYRIQYSEYRIPYSTERPI